MTVDFTPEQDNVRKQTIDTNTEAAKLEKSLGNGVTVESITLDTAEDIKLWLAAKPMLDILVEYDEYIHTDNSQDDDKLGVFMAEMHVKTEKALAIYREGKIPTTV